MRMTKARVLEHLANGNVLVCECVNGALIYRFSGGSLAVPHWIVERLLGEGALKPNKDGLFHGAHQTFAFTLTKKAEAASQSC